MKISSTSKITVNCLQYLVLSGIFHNKSARLNVSNTKCTFLEIGKVKIAFGKMEHIKIWNRKATFKQSYMFQ